jgi:hypothetical protein
MIGEALEDRRRLLDSLQESDVVMALLEHDLDEPMTKADLQAILRAIGTQRPIPWQLAYRLVKHLVSVTSQERVAGMPRCA